LRIKDGNYVGSFSSFGEVEGPLARGLTGYITSFDHQLGDIAKNVAFGKQGSDTAYRALPREIKVTLSFTVVHDELVGWYNGQFSPNGYGNNFPYNAGEFGELGSDARDAAGAAPTTETSAGTSNAAISGPTNASERAADPHGVHNQVMNAQSEHNLEISPHGKGNA
jgi:hypothetical protein